MKAKKQPGAGSAREDAEQAVTVLIRNCSEEGRLISEDEVLTCATAKNLLDSPPAGRAAESRKILNSILKKKGDVQALVAAEGSRRLYSTQFITEAYAVMLLQTQGDPLQLVAAVIRQNSKIYPRPVPMDFFTLPPFEIAAKDVMDYIVRMAKDKSYKDIVMTATSTTRKYLYSSLYLEPAHAQMLAEWFDVGRSDNP
jgi:hypothetical protein